jgi:signal-transduction protein with cAMP-binding, CBS, and nucleotidyltransferase domain
VSDAHQQLLGAVLEQQLIDAERGIPLSNDVDVERLGPSRRHKLAEAIKTIGTLITLVNRGWT